MSRRRKTDIFPLLVIVAVLFGLWLAFQIIVSPLGLSLGAAIIVVALLYGVTAAHQQTEARRIWAKIRDVSTLSGGAFEQHVTETYRRLGYQARLTKKGADAGTDVIADNGIDRIAVQCKQLSSTVGNDAVQQAHTGKAVYGCNRAAVVCTTTFTAPAKVAARATGVELIDGVAYAKLVQRAEATPTASSPLLPGGRALIREIAWIAVGVIILGIHFAGPAFSESGQQLQPPVEPMIEATASYQPFRVSQPSISSPPSIARASKKTARTQAPRFKAPRVSKTPTPNRPPWWTPTPVATETAAAGISVPTNASQPAASPIASPVQALKGSSEPESPGPTLPTLTPSPTPGITVSPIVSPSSS